jgi:ribose 5-phosphate isomerase RpiB
MGKYIRSTQHNDANIAIIPTDCIGSKLAAYLVKSYLTNAFDKGENNAIRVQKLKDLDERYKKN